MSRVETKSSASRLAAGFIWRGWLDTNHYIKHFILIEGGNRLLEGGGVSGSQPHHFL